MRFFTTRSLHNKKSSVNLLHTAARIFLIILLCCCLGVQSYATAWTTSVAGPINSLANWTDGTVAPTSFTTPGDTWTVTLAMTMPSTGTWTLGTASSAAVTLTFATGGTFTISGAGGIATITVNGDMVFSGGTLSLGGAGTTENVNVTGNVTMNTGTISSIASSTHLTINTTGTYSVTGGTHTTTGAGSTLTLNNHGDFIVTGGTFPAGGASGVLTVNCYANGSFSGPCSMTNIGAGCTSVVHFMLPSASGTMMIDNTSTGAWSGTNVYVDAGCTAQLDGNFSTTTGAATFGVIVNGTLICPAAYMVNGTRVFTLNSGATLVVAISTGINGAIITTGTKTFSTGANYTFNGTVAQVTGTYLPVALVSPSVLTISNSAGVTLSQTTATTGTLAFTSGILNTTAAYTMSTPGDATAVTGAGPTSYVNGTLIKAITGFTTVNYEVGDLDYAPMSLALSSAGTAGSIGLMTTNGFHPSVGSSGLSTSFMANHYWTITNLSAAGPTTVTPTATYNAVDIIGGSNSAFLTQEYASSAWLTTPITSTNTATPYTSTPIGGVPLTTLAGDYIFGNLGCGTAPVTGTATLCVGSTSSLSDATAGGTWASSSTGIATVSSSGLVSGIAAGTAIISYTVSGCTATRIITVDLVPTAGTITGATGACVGGTATLTDAATGGTWSSSDPSVATISPSGILTGIAVGTAVISYVVSNSCGTATATLTVTVSLAPVAGTITGTGTVCEGATTTLSTTASGGSWTSSAAGVASVDASGVVTGLSGGTAVISYTVTNSCGTATATMTVTVNPLPVVSPITGVTSACIGFTTSLSDASAGGVWSSSATTVATVDASGVVTGVAAGTAVISYTITNSCGSVSATVNVTVAATLIVAPVTGIDSVCPGQTITLSDATGGGVWSSMTTTIATVSTSGIVTGVAPGYDSIVYTITNSCGTASAKKRIKVRTVASCSVSVVSVEGNTGGELKLFPNPNTGAFTINVISDNDEEIQVVITNIVGEKIMEFTTTTNKATDIRLSVPGGIYIVSAQGVQSNYVAKVIVE